jgi:hypothetical protein
MHTATRITLNPSHHDRANTQNHTFEGNLRISAPMATHRSVAISGALSEMHPSRAAVITHSIGGVQGALRKSQINSKHVHWKDLPVHPPARRGVLRLIAYRPLYNRNLTARPFNVTIRFGQEIRTVKFESLRLMANMLLDFECRLVVAFPEHRRQEVGKLLQRAYALVFTTGGVGNKTKVQVRGALVVCPAAAFMGCMNSVMQGSTMTLEW